MDGGSTAPRDAGRPGARPQDARAAGPRLDSAGCAAEILAIVAYVTADDGPLRASPIPGTAITPWHRRLLLKATERLDVIDAFLRARVAFLVAGRERGYYAPDQEIELAGATLDTCRAAASVVEALLAAQLPGERDFDAMCRAALTINPALDRVRELQGTSRDG